MKKWIAVVLCISLLSVFSGCGKKPSSTNDPAVSSQKQNLEENLLTVKVTIPSYVFSEDDLPEEKLSDEQKKNGFVKAEIHDDGSVTYTILKSKHKKLVETIKNDFSEYLSELDHDYGFVRKTEANDDFSQVTFYVNASEYNNSRTSSDIIEVYYQVLYCRAFLSDDLTTTFIIKNADTDEIIRTTVLPDDLDRVETSEEN